MKAAKYILSLLTAMLLSAADLHSQDEDYREFTVSADYNFPLGKLNWVYKPVPGFRAGLNWCAEDFSEGKISKFGLELSYFNFKPKADTLYYLVPPGGYGVAVYSKYLVASATMHVEKVKVFDNKFRLMIAANGGIAFIRYTSSHVDVNMDYGEESFEGKLVLSPQAGFGYAFETQINLALMAQYNALISLGSQDPDSMSYNSNAGTYRQFCSA